MSGGKVTLELTRDQALVLLELLARTHQERSLGLEDAAERHVLWTVEAMLEKALPEASATDYAYRLEKAREALRDE